MADDQEICGEVHPEFPDVACEKPTPCFYFHTSAQQGGLFWGECPKPPSQVRGGRKMLDQMAGRAERTSRAGSPALALIKHAVVNRQEYEQSAVDPWEEESLEIFHRFLKARRGTFTTPEDLWPLIEAPGEMRRMVQVVRRALRGGWIREVGAVRLTGVYYTRDHREFQMNKLVPVYESLIGPAPVAQQGEAAVSNTAR